jgi:hypothetical protein
MHQRKVSAWSFILFLFFTLVRTITELRLSNFSAKISTFKVYFRVMINSQPHILALFCSCRNLDSLLYPLYYHSCVNDHSMTLSIRIYHGPHNHFYFHDLFEWFCLYSVLKICWLCVIFRWLYFRSF